MKTIYQTYFAVALTLGITACNSSKTDFDATGVFEAEEVIISSESNGKLLALNITEGDALTVGQEVGQVDCQNINLQKAQTEASIAALKLKQNEATPQVKILEKQIETQKAVLATQKEQLTLLEKERKRLQNLVNAEAAPTKQLDDIVGQIEILKKQMTSTQSQIEVISQQISSQKEQISIQNRGILSETQPLQVRVSQIDEQLGHCKVINPIAGTVLVKYAESNEMTGMGKPLYKIADLSTMTLRAYVSGTQLGQVKVNQPVKIFIDNGKDAYKEMQGTISWISSKAEFTPKTIQTKDERENLVYAAKIKVKNDGFIKIGMYGEVKF
ncbi:MULTISPECIES: HlyD family secretion protein [Emticicia]|uniref:HlyD family secretion protein n=1 Tax=Emticicia TaxID=312278 RepID=UPI0007D8AAB0|nr:MULTISPECIES: HlyD family efflux transporter periplasmic adaptor subunit [Emticicia]